MISLVERIQVVELTALVLFLDGVSTPLYDQTLVNANYVVRPSYWSGNARLFEAVEEIGESGGKIGW